MIASFSYDQGEILNSILHLYCGDCFDADITYGNGAFYRDVPEPRLRFDIDPQKPGVSKACSTALPIPGASLSSAVFDPPFLTYVRAGRSGNGDMLMAKRFGGYWTYSELAEHYRETLREARRFLKTGGILVFKCQDIIHNHRMHCTHVNVINWASELGFRIKDLFVLAAKSRMPIPPQKGSAAKVQKHARIFHSYFLVLEAIKAPDNDR